jgi:hypothetical protein
LASPVYFPAMNFIKSPIKVKLWMLELLSLTQLLVVLDYTYRAYRSVALFAK